MLVLKTEIKPLKPSPMATLAFEGLGLFKIQEENPNVCKVSLVPGLPGHSTFITINKVEGQQVEPVQVPTQFLSGFVQIEIDKPLNGPGVQKHLGPDPFNRAEPNTDIQDFRWMIDLEGPDYHNKPLNRVMGANGQPKVDLKPVFTITSGTAYTQELSPSGDQLSRFRWDAIALPRLQAGDPQPNDIRLIGLVGHKLGIDLESQTPNDDKVTIKSVDQDGNIIGNPLLLPGGDGIRYEITISNICAGCNPVASPGFDLTKGTDFRNYYDILEDPAGIKFDFRINALKQVAPSPVLLVPEDPKFALSQNPIACQLGGGG